MKNMKYKIWYSHCGDAPEVYSTFYANSDAEAQKKLKKCKQDPSNGYGELWMDRIDVEEKTTRI